MTQYVAHVLEWGIPRNQYARVFPQCASYVTNIGAGDKSNQSEQARARAQGPIRLVNKESEMII